MRKENVVRRKLQQVLFRHRKKLLQDNFDRRPDTCAFNVELREEGCAVCVCSHEQLDEVVCDARFGGVARAQGCPLWKERWSSEEVKQNFKEFVESGDLGALAQRYPDVVALMWVLGEDFEITLGDVQEEEEERSWLENLMGEKR